MKKHDLKRDFQPEGNKIAMSAIHENRFSNASAAQSTAPPANAKNEVKAE